MDNESIGKMIDEFDKDSKALRKNIMKMCWYMRGGISLEEAWELGYNDRELINSIIEENLEITEKTKLPFF